MNSFILISKNPDQQNAYLNSFIGTQHISPFDVVRISSENSVGIEIVRRLQETIFLKPFKGKEKVILIENAQQLTTEAQNALLKLLEEPPLFVSIFLCATTAETFLPTVLSRCTIISLNTPPTPVSGKDKESIEENLHIIMQGSVEEKLALAETIAADKNELPKWFERIVLFAREKMLEEKNDTRHFAHIVRALQEGYTICTTTNVSPRTILEHCFLTM